MAKKYYKIGGKTPKSQLDPILPMYRGGMRGEHDDDGNECDDENFDTALDDPEVLQGDDNPEENEEDHWDNDDDYDPAHEQKTDMWEHHVQEIMSPHHATETDRGRGMGAYNEDEEVEYTGQMKDWT